MKYHLFFSKQQTKTVAFGVMFNTLALVWLAGCNILASNNVERPGKLQIKLTDAPAGYDSVMIDIRKVEVQNVDSANGWVVVNDSATMVNLLDLTNGAYKVIGQKQLDPGTYSQIRLVLGPDNYVVENGQHHTLEVPSGQQSGLKIDVNATIKPGFTYTLLLDFDAARSIVETGNSHSKNSKFILKPVIRAVNEALTGSIAGTVAPANARPAIYGINGADTVSTVFADTTSGEFKLIGFPAGIYDVSIVPADTTYRDTTITGISVIAGQTQQLDTVILSKK